MGEPTIEQAAERLLDDIRDAERQRKISPRAYHAQFPFLPPSIGLGDGRMVFLGPNGTHSLQQLSAAISKRHPTAFTTSSSAELLRFTTSAAGKILRATMDSDGVLTVPDDPCVFGDEVCEQTIADFESARVDLKHIFGAWVFRSVVVNSVSVGPVYLSERTAWLDHTSASTLLNPIEARRIRRAWSGAHVRPRKARSELHREQAVLDAVGPCPWVCIVDLRGHTLDRSREKALIASRTAIAAVSLAWEPTTHDERNMGLHYDVGDTRRRSVAAFGPGGTMSSSREKILRGLRFIKNEDLSYLQRFLSDMIPTVGTCIDTFISPDSAHPHPKLASMICRSVLWYGEAAREPLDSLAIVKYGAALDTLGNGHGARGIRNVLQVRLGITDLDKPILGDGTTPRKLVDQVYAQGRSRIAHGTRDGFLEDLAQLRFRSAFTARLAILASIEWLSSYAGTDSREALHRE